MAPDARAGSLLDVRGLSKRFGGLQAVSDLSLAMAEGEMLGLIGPNGAGKTTVFNLVSGFLGPDKGEIRFGGRSIVGLKPHAICRQGLARTFQLVTRHAHAREALEQARAVVARVGLAPKAAVAAGSLTLADRKRLEMARALATEPTLLLLDEVMAGLNATEIEAIVRLIAGINESGVSILLIEHNMRAVMALSHRIVVLSFGEKIAEGPPSAVASDARVIEAYLGEEYVHTAQA